MVISLRTNRLHRFSYITWEDTPKCSVDSWRSWSLSSLSRTDITPLTSTPCPRLPRFHLPWASLDLLRSQHSNSPVLNHMLGCTKRITSEFKTTFIQLVWEDLTQVTSVKEVDRYLLPLTSLCCILLCHLSIYNNLRHNTRPTTTSGSLFHKIPCKVPSDPTFTSTHHLGTTWICDRFRFLQQQVKRQSLPAQASLVRVQTRLQCLLQTSARLTACHISRRHQ